jgi:hypothetical protein
MRTPVYILLFFTAALYSMPMPSLTIDSLYGRVEIQRSGKSDWKPAKQGMKFENNDCIRTFTSSKAYLKWPDGTLTFINGNSKAQINIIPNDSCLFVSHVTIFSGDFFFVSKNSQSAKNSSEIKIYTPALAATIKGASFETRVDSTGTTVVSVINGTVNLANLNNNASIYLPAPFKASVSKSTNPINRSAIIQNDIDTLKSWVPPFIIDAEIRSQLAKSKRDFLILTGKSNGECLVVPFENVSTYKGNWQIGKVLASSFAQKLQNAAALTAVNFKDSSGDPLLLARDAKIEYLITAKIENFDLVQQAEISANAEEYREFAIARVRIEITLTKVDENRIIDQEILSGEVSTKNKTESTWTVIGKLNFSLEDQTFSKSILGLAIQQVLDQATEKILKFIE